LVPETLSADRTALLMYTNGIEFSNDPAPLRRAARRHFYVTIMCGKRYPALTIGDDFKTAIRVRLFA
jgi:hypothetical protein